MKGETDVWRIYRTFVLFIESICQMERNARAGVQNPPKFTLGYFNWEGRKSAPANTTSPPARPSRSPRII
jgi:hypothetical protein